MTLIVAAGVDTFPAIFGDLLVTGAVQGGPRTSPDGQGGASEWSVLEPGQKVVLLGDNCVVAWSGAIEPARTVVRELRAMAREVPLSMQAIDAYLSQLGPALKDEISLVGWLGQPGDFRQFWYRADTAESALFGRISAGGTGATKFAQFASNISKDAADIRGGAPNALARAMSSMLSATSLLFRADLSSRDDVVNPFDGAYEIATFIGGKFAKVRDITFVFWTADVTEKGTTLKGPELMMKQDYAGELLLVHLLRMRAGQVKGDHTVVEEARYVIPPFGDFDTGQLTDISWPRMDSTFTCHVVVARSSKGVAVFNQIEFSQSRTPHSIGFSFDDKSIPFAINQDFFNALVENIQASLERD